jgi:thiol-disulfide isomerase/thioredoxin
MKRRDLAYAGVAATAVTAGAGLAWWRLHPQTPEPDAFTHFWNAKMQTPQGEALNLTSLQGKALLINFWATWCPPCVEEMPLINTFFRENSSKGWQVLGIAADKAEPVKAFVNRHNIAFPIAIGGASAIELGRKMGNKTGGLPFSVALSAQGEVIARKIGKLHPQDLQAWASLASR